MPKRHVMELSRTRPSIYDRREAKRRSNMPAVEEVMSIVQKMTDEERIELRRRLDEFDEQ